MENPKCTFLRQGGAMTEALEAMSCCSVPFVRQRCICASECPLSSR